MARQRNGHRKSRSKKAANSNFVNALRRLKQLKASERHQALTMANASFIRQFCKQLRKLKHMKLSIKKKRALGKYKNQLRQLTNAKTTLSKRRRILTQKGGSAVVKTILAVLPIVGGFLKYLHRQKSAKLK